MTGGAVEVPLAMAAMEAAAPAAAGALGSGLTAGGAGLGLSAGVPAAAAGMGGAQGLIAPAGAMFAGSALPGAMAAGGSAAPLAATFGMPAAQTGLSSLLGAKDLMSLGMNASRMGQPERGTPQNPMVMAPAVPPPNILPFSSLNPYTRGGRKVY